MIPNNRLSDPAILGTYLYPDNIATSKKLDFELGGVDLQDPSQGLKVKKWAAYIDGQDIWLAADDRSPVIVLTRPGVLTEVSLAFDQNMRYNIVFVEDNITTLYWYNTSVANYVLTLFPNTETPRLCLDDKRDTQTGTSDIILGYIKDNGLYFRAQRDRYTIEYLLRTSVNATLDKMGMTNKARLQFYMIPVT